jgi:hypothetical protein
MGDRAVVEFYELLGVTPTARLYFHNEASALPELWLEFLAWNDGRFEGDNRYDDAAYLAARFVVWYTTVNWGENWLIRGLGIGIDNHTGDYRIAYRVTETLGYGIPALVVMSESEDEDKDY